jgi:septum formation protein
MNSDPLPVLLASSSTYRRELLTRILPEFDWLAPNVDETPHPDEDPQALAVRLSALKANEGARQRPGMLVIGSDQVAALGARLLSKPGTNDNAAAQLAACSGRKVDFFTAVTVAGGNAPESTVDHTTVCFRDLDPSTIQRYLKADQPYDCAGSFKAESLGIALFSSVESVDPTAIQGLPLIWLSACLTRNGIRTP